MKLMQPEDSFDEGESSMSMIRKSRNHPLQTNPQHREEEQQNTNCVSRRLHNLFYLNVIHIQQVKVHIVLEKYDRMFFLLITG